MTSTNNIFLVIFLILSWLSYCIGVFYGIKNGKLSISPEKMFVDNITICILFVLISITIISADKIQSEKNNNTDT
jgi:hypothetical protein